MRNLTFLYRLAVTRSVAHLLHSIVSRRLLITKNRLCPITHNSNNNVAYLLLLLHRLCIRLILISDSIVLPTSRLYRIRKRTRNIGRSRHLAPDRRHLILALRFIRNSNRGTSALIRHPRRHLLLLVSSLASRYLLYKRLKMNLARLHRRYKRRLTRRYLTLIRRHMYVPRYPTRSATSSVSHLNVTKRLAVNSNRNSDT